MSLVDLHCDTLYRAVTENGSLFDNTFHISLSRGEALSPYIQCLAVWIPDEYRGEAAANLFERCVDQLHRELQGTRVRQCMTAHDVEETIEQHRTGVILTVESGAVLQGELDRIPFLRKAGVRMMTLTWNGSNELGDGIGVENAGGLTDFGRQALPVLEENDIILDVSHASEPLFEEVASLARRPFVASHSDARAVCPHRRNLTDDQFRRIQQKGGIVGLNFCRDFLHKDGTKAKMYDIIRNAEHFWSLGGEETLALGGDFDGAEIPFDMEGLEAMPRLYELFLHHQYPEQLVKALFFENAVRFFSRYESRQDLIERKKETT